MEICGDAHLVLDERPLLPRLLRLAALILHRRLGRRALRFKGCMELCQAARLIRQPLLLPRLRSRELGHPGVEPGRELLHGRALFGELALSIRHLSPKRWESRTV